MKRCLLFAAAALALAAGAPALAHEPLGDEIAALSRRIQAGTAGPAEYLRRGELFRLSGDFAEAKADYDRAERLDPTRAEIHSCRGALLSDLGQPRHAASELDRYLELRPRSRDALALRARVAMALGRAWEAVPFLSRALTVGPATPDLYLERARIQAALPGGHVDEAVQGLREGIARLGPVVGLELYAANLERGTSHAAMTAGGAARARVAPSAPARGATAPSAPPPNVSRRTARVVTRVLPRRSAAAAALASPIVTRGPYLQEGTSSSVIVRWRTDPATDSRVSFGTKREQRSFHADDATLTTEHEVLVSGLSPGTRYTYAVGTSVGELRGDDGSLSFVTAPPPGTSRPTRLWILGDSGTASREARAVRDAYYAYAGGRPPDVWLMLGDNAYDSGTDAQYQAAVFDMYPSTLASTVLWPTRGNHDVVFDGAGNDYYDIFSLPTHAEAGGIPSGAEAYYSFDYGDIHLICLDSEGSDRRADGAMMTWLASDLAATTRTWVIAFWHHPPYSKGSHDSDDPGDSGGRMRDMREHALPILEAGGVDLVLTGHSHSYERSFLLDGHYGLSSSLTDAMKVDARDGRPGGAGPYHKPEEARAAHEGAVYAVAGTSGQTSGGSLDHPIMITSLNVLGSLVLDVKGHRLDGRFLDASGAIRDSFAIVKSGKGARGAAPAVVSSIRPNPAVGSTAIGFELAQPGRVSLTIVDASGRRIRTLVRETRAAGRDEIVWDGRDGSGRRVRAGVYFASIELGGRVSSRRLIITR